MTFKMPNGLWFGFKQTKLGTSSFPCELCGYESNRTDQIKKHMESVHIDLVHNTNLPKDIGQGEEYECVCIIHEDMGYCCVQRGCQPSIGSM